MVTPTESDAEGPDAPAPHPGPGTRTGSPGPSPAASPGAPGSRANGSGGDLPSPPTGAHGRNPGRVALGVLAFLLIAFLLGATFVPLPYYLFKPGSVRDTEPLITVDGTEVFPSSGSISYTTVSLRQASLLGLAQGWLDDDIDVYSRETVLQGRDVDENRRANLQMMDNSKQVATQVALERLGYDVDVTIGHAVDTVEAGLPAEGVLEPDDTIVAVDGERFDDSGDMARLLAAHPPGSSVRLTVLPPGTDEKAVDITLAADPRDADRGVMGVTVYPRVLAFDFPVDVEIDTGDVGGPSAGLAFTLAIIDDLTPGDLTGGHDVATTGTMAGDGTVGPVGGTGQKAAAVRAQDVELFLVPRADYPDAVARAGSDLKVVAVDDLDDALDALADLGGNADDLPAVGAEAG